MLMKGTKVRCRIEGKKTDGVVQIVDGFTFICQNYHDGMTCGEDKMGYKYSWCIGKKGHINLEVHGVSNLRILLPKEKEIL